MRTHIVTNEEFTGLAAGVGSPAVIASLRAAQVSRRLLLLRAIADQAGSAWLESAYALLADVQRQRPRVVGDRFRAPPLGTLWALAMRALRTGDRSGAEVLTGQLGVFAVAAAIRAGVDFSLDIPAVHGGV